MAKILGALTQGLIGGAIIERRLWKKNLALYTLTHHGGTAHTEKEEVLQKAAESHYPTMSFNDIRKLPVNQIAADDAALFLWVTFPVLGDALEIIKDWGFNYKTVAFVWIKTNRKAGSLFWGMGFWTRSNAELCLLATRGCPKRQSAAVHQVIMHPAGKHSSKPGEVRERIVQLLGDVPRIELFAREKVDGWSAWGDEVDCDVQIGH